MCSAAKLACFQQRWLLNVYTAGKRLAQNPQWIREIRDDYASFHVPRPVPVDHIFRQDQVSAMQNKLRNSLSWMPDHVPDKYHRLQEVTEAEQQNKGKRQIFFWLVQAWSQAKDQSRTGPQLQERTVQRVFLQVLRQQGVVLALSESGS